MRIRLAESADYSSMRDIYAYYVENTDATADYFAPSRTAFLAKMKAVTPDFPAFVAEDEGEIVGFSYLDRLCPQDGYRWNAAENVYVDKSKTGSGVGTLLARACEEAARYMGFRRVLALVTDGSDAQEFFEKREYIKTAAFASSGYKRGKVLGTALLEKDLGDDDTFKDRPRRMSEVRAKDMDGFLSMLNALNGDEG